MKTTQLKRWLLPLTLALFLLFPGLAMAQGNGAHLEVQNNEIHGELTTNSDETFQQIQAEPTAPAPTIAGILARNALTGGVTGALIGTGVWLLVDGFGPWTVAQFAGGGLVVGTVIGAVEIATRPDIMAMDTTPDSVVWVQQETPETFQVPVLKLDF